MAGVEELEARIVKLEQRQQLLQRVDPAIALGTALHDLGEIPTARVWRATTQTIGTGASTAISFSSVAFDTDGMYDSSNATRITVNVAGVYLCTGRSAWSADPVNGAIIIRENGDTEFARVQIVEDHRTMGITDLRYFDIGDYVELLVRQGSGGDLTTLTTAGQSSDLALIKLANKGEL